MNTNWHKASTATLGVFLATAEAPGLGAVGAGHHPPAGLFGIAEHASDGMATHVADKVNRSHRNVLRLGDLKDVASLLA